MAARLPGLGQKDLMKLLVDPVLAASGSGIHKQGKSYFFYLLFWPFVVGFDDFFSFLGKASIAKCVAALVVTQNPAEAQAVVSFLLLF